MSDASKPANGTRKKKTPSAFKRPGGESMFSSVIAGADEVVANSFIAQGNPAPTGPPAAFRAPAPNGPAQPTPAAAPAASPAPAAAPAEAQPAPASSPSPAPAPAPTVAVAPALERAETVGPSAAVPTALPVVEERPVQVVTAPQAVVEPAAALPAQPKAEPPTAAGRAPAQRRRPVRRAGGWAHQAVTESFADSVISSNTWTTLGFRIVPEILTAVKARLAADRRSSGNAKLAVGHYLDAALRNAPAEVGDQVASAQAFLTQRMGVVDSGRQSTYRVGPQARALATSLNAALQEADHARKGIFVVSAALESLLASLETEGELPSPSLFAREG
ncbi:hypothetical protein [Streptacidiphilus carbonis]|uniref:hypothetical protein n=1 Tax=Streptacidiphilus carbonis TaxID=105422 RepID=UPI001F34ADFB|nr:hypothetical protein [Streptacidiphilus carbonis]